MNEKEKFFNIWQQAVKDAARALKSGDIKAADMHHQKMEDAYERYKEAANYESSMADAQFSTLNATLESALPKLLNKNGKVLKECIKLIKGDKNLLSQFKFCNAMKKYNCDGDAVGYVNESLELVMKNIDRKTLKESNRKFAKFILKNGIKPEEEITEGERKYHKSCDYLLSHKKNLSNLTEITNNVKVVSDYITENRKIKGENVDVFSMAEAVEKKMNLLNEDEKSLVSIIMDANTPAAEVKKMNLFNNIKRECVEKINKLIDEGNDVERLQSLKETIVLKEYNSETIVKDIAKLLEVGAILSDSDHDKYL